MDLRALRELDEKTKLEIAVEFDSFLDELGDRAIDDPWCLECAADVADHILDFEEACKALSPEQREKVDAYIHSCEEFERANGYLAYLMGREHERKGLLTPRMLL